MSEFEQIATAFGLDDSNLCVYGNGHINDTYVVTKHNRKMILQRLNTAVFKKPVEVMQNICGVTEFLKDRIKNDGGDPLRETMTVVPTLDGSNCLFTKDNSCFRMYEYIDDSYSLEKADCPEQMTSAAETIGRFYQMLSDYPAEKLATTIPDFHNTRNYFNRLMTAADNDVKDRKMGVEAELVFAKKHEKLVDVLNEAMDDGSAPLRVTHNDTKLNNILFDKRTDKGMCVIDLDTVMPGSVLYDFGDAMRFGASSGPEDEKNLSKIWFDLDMFDAFTKGFSHKLSGELTGREKELLVDSVKIITLECGMRFLEDYLNGDTYFKTARPEHNLDRARTQFKLVADMENKSKEMLSTVEKYFG